MLSGISLWYTSRILYLTHLLQQYFFNSFIFDRSVMYVKTCLIHDGQPVLQKKLKLGQHCSSKHKIKYAACDIDANTSLQVSDYSTGFYGNMPEHPHTYSTNIVPRLPKEVGRFTTLYLGVGVG